MTTNGWLKATEIHCVTILEAKSPKSRCGQGPAPSAGSQRWGWWWGEESSLASCLVSGVTGNLWLFFFFLTMPPNIWDLSSPTIYQTHALKAWMLNNWTTREVQSLVLSAHSYITAISTSIFTGLLPVCPCLYPNFPLLVRTSVILDLG